MKLDRVEKHPSSQTLTYIRPVDPKSRAFVHKIWGTGRVRRQRQWHPVLAGSEFQFGYTFAIERDLRDDGEITTRLICPSSYRRHSSSTSIFIGAGGAVEERRSILLQHYQAAVEIQIYKGSLVCRETDCQPLCFPPYFPRALGLSPGLFPQTFDVH